MSRQPGPYRRQFCHRRDHHERFHHLIRQFGAAVMQSVRTGARPEARGRASVWLWACYGAISA